MTYEEFYSQFHIQINQQQSEAVRSVDGPVLLLAVPGSGKTTVLVTRLGYMIYCAGIVPENILTLTYTVAAARDMADRCCACFGNKLRGRMQFRTINGICAKVIQYYGNRIGKQPFSLVTENDMLTRMLSDIYRRIEGVYATESDLKGIRGLVTYIKNMMLSGEEIKTLDEESGFKISEIYRAYCNELHVCKLMDYDDQMIYACNILRKSPETLQYFQNQYTYICVDEAQDTSKIQHEIIRLLAGKRDNLFMVGDEDQSIYGFRAAYPEALLAFERNHFGAKVLLMEENFRSDAKIVAAADRFIQKNMLRHEKHMTAAREGIKEIQKIVLKDRNAQYSYLVKAAAECGGQMAVLYRNNESALPLIDRLERQGIPYKIRNMEMAFFTHRIVQDIRNIICFAMNPKDTELFLQVYYKIWTYINKQDAVRICEISRREDKAVLETALLYGELPVRTMESCKRVRTHLKSILSERADAAIERIASRMGYGDYLERMGMSDGKLFILKAIAENEDSSGRFLKRLDELREILEKEQENSPNRHSKYENSLRRAEPVILSTIHSSKGLEYDTVYLMDVVDGVFPESVPKNIKVMDRAERTAYEEERRLFYVGVTRAKNELFVFRLDRKSSFCEELLYKEKMLREKTGQVVKPKLTRRDSAPTYVIRKKPFLQEEYKKFLDSIGDGLIVKHKKLGEGVIVEVQKDKVIIQFGEERRMFGLKALYDYDLLLF